MKLERLGQYVKIRTGKLDANASSPNGEYPFFTCSVNPLRISSYSYDCECILIAGNGDLNVKYYEGKFDAYQRTYIIEPLNKEVLNVRYLYHFMDKYVERLREMSIGGVIKYIKLNYLTDAQIPLPPLREQMRIAEILDKADALREKRRLALQKLDTLLQSVFLEMFGDPVKNPKGWEVSDLGGICKRVTDGTHQPPKFAGTGIPFLFVSNIRKGIMTFTTNKFISEDTYSELTRRCPIEIDDILYTIVGSYGNAAVVKTSEKFAFQRHIAHIKPNLQLINSEFLLWMLLSDGVRRQVDKKVRGIAQQTLNLSEIKTLQIFCPPKSLQEKFASISKEINKLKTCAIKSEVFSENLFQSLQQRAFKGELFNNEIPIEEPQEEEKVWHQTSLF